MKVDKDVMSYSFAGIALLVGFGLTIAGFIVDPLGIVSESVLWVLGQCFVFAGGICGISIHVDNATKKMQNEIRKEFEKKI